MALALGLSALGSGGCAATANVTTDQLPLSRVVVYRNGVGYFERAGEVESDEVRFKMKQRMVGDFLATLAIVEHGGSSVRSASFPLEIEGEEEPPSGDPRLYSMLKPLPPEPEPSKTAKDLKDVVLHLDGQRHTLAVGYVSETPVWRPSYRLVVQEDGSADLQAWGIVQNLSGEDWSQVKLVLVAGAPLAFESTLGDPVVPQRPIVTDQGEVIAAVPEGLTTLSTEVPPPPPEAEPMPVEEKAEEGYGYDMDDDVAAADAPAGLGMRGTGAGGGGRATARPAPKPTASASSAPMKKDKGKVSMAERRRIALAEAQQQGPSGPRNVSALAAVAVDSGTTRYAIPNPVTVPNESATMVLLVAKKVRGEAMFLFSPDGGVPESSSHPFRVARFKNDTKGLLERGPIAVFQQGSFLGQGMVEPLPPKASATVPFALERSLLINSDLKVDRRHSRLYKIENGQIMIERDVVYETTYGVKNGGGEPAKLLIKHPRRGSSTLFEPPKGTEDNVDHALVPLNVKPHSDGKLLVEERQPSQEWASWTSDLAREAIEAFLKSPPKEIDAERVERLRKAWELRNKLKTSEDEQNKLSLERNELERFAREDRLKLKSLEKNRFADDLKRTLTQRLAENTKRMEQIEKRLVEVSLAIEEQRIRFADALRGLRIVMSRPQDK
ncbi:MAG: DUF4139 domain-containing protein [Polyangiaceae bacterium]|nr:DUF4139 domain-containing protein [Polyangiaceae bacterium]MCB9606337.1 DUF4139 domain-containing protein [Polyangiaceae bacterium]